MKVLILAGGYGTRLSEVTEVKPKPMVEIGGDPVLYHIMKIYSHYGFNDFVVLLGYKGYVIKEYFANYFLHQSDVTIDLKTNEIEVHGNKSENWRVTLLDTGMDTMTGGRVKRAKDHIGNEPFLLTYGDGVGDIDIKAAVDFHKSHGKLMTLTAVQPEGRYGALGLDGDRIHTFAEKPQDESTWINGGFFVCQPEVLDHIDGDHQMLEREPIESITAGDNLMAYKHHGFWHAMDTLRDNRKLNQLWSEGQAPWKVW